LNYLKFFLINILLIIGLTGCAQLKSLTEEKPRQRQFKVKQAWVRPGPSVENLKYRKLHRMRPLVFEELLIEGNGTDSVVAYKRNTGGEVWRVNIPNGVEASATLINNRLFLGGLDGQYYAIKAETGEILWTFPTRAENLSEPLLVDGNLYFQTGNNTVYALDAATGKQLWLYSRQDPNTLSIRGGSKPALKNDTLYVGFSDGSLVALLAKNGALKWEKQLNKNKKFKDIDSDPVVDGEFLYIMGYDDHFYALRTANGDVAWKSEKGGWGRVAILGDRLFYATSTGEVVSLNKETGQKIWNYTLKDGVATSPSLYKGLVAFGESQGSLVFLDSGTGKIISSFDPGKGGILSQISTDEKAGRVYFISGEANVFAMNASWELTPIIKWLR
jgi:outer membrane protein assembly factor BamB